MIDFKKVEVWFVTGSQHLYGEETLKQVAEHSQAIATLLNDAKQIFLYELFLNHGKNNRRNICCLPGSKYSKKLHWHHRMDAYIFSCKNVD